MDDNKDENKQRKNSDSSNSQNDIEINKNSTEKNPENNDKNDINLEENLGSTKRIVCKIYKLNKVILNFFSLLVQSRRNRENSRRN